MTVYVDELFVTPGALTDPQANRVFGNGKQSCHMTADTTEELLAMAEWLGLKRTWLQHAGRPTQHFDLTPGKRAAAIRAGARPTTAREEYQRMKGQDNG